MRIANRITYSTSKVKVISRRIQLLFLALGLVIGGIAVDVVAAVPAMAANCGAVLATVNGVDVKSNGSYEGAASSCGGAAQNTAQTPGGTTVTTGYEWQCVEFVNRYYALKGWINSSWIGNGSTLKDNLPSGLTFMANGSINSIVVGDVVTLNYSTYGHAGVVSAVNGNTITIANQNAGSVYGTATYDPTHKTLTSEYSGYTTQGVIHATANTGSTAPLVTPHVPGNWIGNNKTTASVFRPSNGTWHYLDGGDVAQQYGQSGDIPVPGYYTGSGKLDWAVFRPSNSTWYIMNQATHGYSSQPFGASGDIPVPGDYDGNGKTELAVFRPSNSTWYWLSPGGTSSQSFGSPGDIPVPAYWDGGNKVEPGVYRPSTGTWYYLTPSGVGSQQFGASGDIPVPGYYTGSSKPDFAVFRPSNSTWYVMNQTTHSYSSQSFGSSGDIPVPGDYDGNGKTELAVFRPSNSTWYWLSPGGTSSQSFGSPGDIPAVATLPYPLLQQFGLMP